MPKLEFFDQFKKTPRVLDKLFYKTYENPPLLFGKADFAEEAAIVPLVYGIVVQAHKRLYMFSSEAIFGNAVILYTLDERKMYDIPFLTEVRSKVIEIRDMDSPLTEHKEIHTLLNDEKSDFKIDLPLSVSYNVPFRMETKLIAQSESLPDWQIPDNHILPFYNKKTANKKSTYMLFPKGELWSDHIDCNGDKLKK
jgi:hypothetical protein